jgi:two-component system response regulator (stage 0 sporulation protein F)
MTALGRLLIVDDEQPVLEVLGEYFTAQGYEVATADGGAEALAAVRRIRPDVVLLDIRMPGMDGIEVLRRLRQQDERLAVIMVTANEDVALARETLEIGAFDYVAKPFDFRYLDRAVAAALMQGERGGPAPNGDAEDVWRHLAVTVFRLARQIPSAGRASTGERLEAAALGAARAAGAGRPGIAAEWLAEIDVLMGIAEVLGDLAAGARSPVDAALGAARKALPRG